MNESIELREELITVRLTVIFQLQQNIKLMSVSLIFSNDSSNGSQSSKNQTIVPSNIDSCASSNDTLADDSIYSLADSYADPDFEASATVNRDNRPVTRIREELDAHAANCTWELVDLPTGRILIRSKWVFKRKTNALGEVIRYKARLVVKGCSQTEGIDYNEIYAPVVRYASIGFSVSLAAQYNLKIYQMDAITAILQGELGNNLYVST